MGLPISWASQAACQHIYAVCLRMIGLPGLPPSANQEFVFGRLCVFLRDDDQFHLLQDIEGTDLA